MNLITRNTPRILGLCAVLAACGGSTPAAPGSGQAQTQPSAPAASTPAATSGSASVGTAGVVAARSTSTSAANGGAAAPAAAAGMPAGDAGRPAAVGGMGAAGLSAAQPAAGSNASAGSGPTTHAGPSGTTAFPKVSDFGADGPFKAMTMENAGPNMGYTIYYPDPLAPNGASNPIVAWMSGGGTNPTLYPLLPLLATHGFVVVASNTTPGIGDEVNLGKEMLAGIDWAIAEHARDGSAFAGKLEVTKIAATGYSMGSLATFTIANDPRITTTVHISGGNMAPERIDNLRAPAAFFCGIPGDDTCNILSNDCDIAAANCDTDYENAKTSVFYGNFAGGHLGILSPPLQQQIQTEVVAWLRWQLMGDAELKPRFVGDQCSVCKDSRWKVKQKNLN